MTDFETTGNAWGTPDHILERVRVCFAGGIELDPCSWPTNPTAAAQFYTEKTNGLVQDWGRRRVYCNPPYGRGLMVPWAEKITREASKGAEIIALTRGDTSTKWARELLTYADRVCFPPRIKFRGATGSPNFANIFWYLGPNTGRFWLAFHDLGPILKP